jgi:putative ABC transport system substrate-binding protein
MQRREFIKGLVGSTASWPLRAHAQQGERVRLIGVLLPIAKDDPDYQPWVGALRQALQELGWVDGRNVRIDIHWATTNPAEIRRQAAELAALAPDVILAPGTSTVGPLMRATHTVPIVFSIIADPVSGGFVDSLARPGGNAPGFMLFEYSISGKWLELLKQIAPGVKRVAVLGDPDTPTGPAQFGVIQAVAPSLRVEVSSFNKRDASEIERVVTAFARSPNGGLIVTAGGPALLNRDLIIALAARHKLPAIYFDRLFVAASGLLSYGPDRIDLYRRAAGYVDRILKRDKPADMPVQAPTKYQLVINLKTVGPRRANASPTARGRADRIAIFFAAVHESAFGPKQTCHSRQSMSAFGVRADMKWQFATYSTLARSGHRAPQGSFMLPAFFFWQSALISSSQSITLASRPRCRIRRCSW